MSNVDVIRGFYAAVGKGDIPGVLGAMAKDIVWMEAEGFPYCDGNPYVGPEAVLNGVFARLGSEWTGFSATPEEILDAGDTVVGLGRYGGAYKSTGIPITAQFAHIYRLRDGKITGFQQYTDTRQVERAISD